MEIDTLALCSAPSNSSFVGISLATGPKEPNSIFATFQNVGVHQYDLQEQRCLQSWLVPSDTVLSLAAVQHPATGDLFCVQDGRTVLSWSKAALSTDQWRKRKFDAQVSSLLFQDNMKQHLVVVLVDGRSFICTTDLTESTSIQGAVKGTVVLSHIVRAAQNFYLFLLCAEASTVLHIVEFSTTSPHTAKPLHAWPLPDKDASKIHSSFFSYGDRQIFLLREDCTWQTWRWDNMSVLLHSAPEQGASRSLKNFAAPQTTGKRRKSGASTEQLGGSVVVAPFRSSIVLIAGVSDGKPTLTFWDTQYGTLLGSHPLSEGASPATERIVGVVASPDHRWAVVALSSRAVLCPVHCPPASLALALGKLPATAEFATDASLKPPVSAPIALQEQIAALLHAPATRCAGGADVELSEALWGDALCAHDKQEQAAIETLRDPSLSSAKFTEAFNKYVASKRKEAEPYLIEAPRKIRSKDIAKREEHERKMNRRRREAMAEAGLSEHFVSTIGEVALKAKHWGPLEYLIKSRCLYAHTLPDLITALIEHKRLDLVYAALTHMPDIPEPDMLAVLRYVLGADAHSLADFLHKSTGKRGQDAEAARALLLSQLLRLPRNEVFLTQQLRELPSAEVEALLGYLSKQLEDHITGTTSDAAPPHGDVIDWLCITIDAHLPLLLAANSPWASKVDGLRERVRAEARLCELATPVHSFLSTITSGKKLPLAEVPDYRIETLKF